MEIINNGVRVTFISDRSLDTVGPLSVFFISQTHYVYKKLSLYIQIPNIYLGLGFEFGPQRIRI